MNLRIHPNCRIPAAVLKDLAAEYGCEVVQTSPDTFAIRQQRMDACDSCGETARLIDGLCEVCLHVHYTTG